MTDNWISLKEKLPESAYSKEDVQRLANEMKKQNELFLEENVQSCKKKKSRLEDYLED